MYCTFIFYFRLPLLRQGLRPADWLMLVGCCGAPFHLHNIDDFRLTIYYFKEYTVIAVSYPILLAAQMLYVCFTSK